MLILDANAVLRYVLKDIPDQAEKVAEAILNNETLILPEVVAETVYVLGGQYGLARDTIADVISDVLDDTESSNDYIRDAIRAFSLTKLDFVDCLLFAYSKTHLIFTFDKKLNSFIKRGFIGPKTEHS